MDLRPSLDQLGERLTQEGGVTAIQTTRRSIAARLWNDFFNARITAIGVDPKKEGPRSGSHEDMGVRPADPDCACLSQLARAEDRHGWNQHVFLPGQLEAGLDQQLMSVCPDDLAFRSTELKSVQRIADCVASGGPAGFVQRFQEPC